MTVKKRNGEIEEFDLKKVERVITLAAKRVKEFIPEDLMNKVLKYVENKVKKLDEPILTKDIQRAVEEALMKYNLFDVEMEFHDECARQLANRRLSDEVFEEMDIKLSGKRNDRQNANVDEETFGGKMGEASDVLFKEKALDYMIKKLFTKLHREFKNYIHDLSRWAVAMHNCLTYPIDNITAKAATIKIPKALRVPGGIESLMQICLVHLQSQSQDQFGGVSLSHMDWTSVKFIRKTFFKHFMQSLKEYADYTEQDLGAMILALSIEKKESSKVSIEDDHYKAFGKVYKHAMDKTVQSVHQACESFLHNANTLQSRSGNQLPFTSINYGTCTLKEGQIFSEQLLNAWEEGIGELGLTPIFPCGILQMKRGINYPGDPNYFLFQKALKILPKRIYPNFANADWSVDRAGFEKSQHIKQNVLESLDEETLNKVKELPLEVQETLGFHFPEGQLVMNDYPQPNETMSTMGCRTYNGFDINFTEDYFLNKVLLPTLETGELPLDQLWSGNQKDGRGNIAPNTVVMPFYAMEAKKKAERSGHPEYVVDYFLNMLETAISNSKDELIDRFNWIAAQPKSVSKYMHCENHTMLGWDEEEGLRSVMKHGTLAIGQLGLAETLQILVGCDHTEERGMSVAIKIEELFNHKCAEYKERYKLNFGVYMTPAENLCYTAFKAFKKKYKDVENVTYYINEKGEKVDKEFFTNSIHVPVYKKISIYKKFEIEAKLAKYSNAGCITYGEIADNSKHNIKALEQIVLYGLYLDLPYIALNFVINECTQCGNTDNLDEDVGICPICGATKEFINWLKRITGYLNGNYLKAFNLGKQDEVRKREDHDIENCPTFEFKNIKVVN